MPERLAVLVWAATPDRADLCATPLVHALAARALDAEVEVHFAGPAVRWLVEGVAAAAFPGAEREKSIADFLAELDAAGVRLLACGMARAAWVAADEAMLTASGAAGATAFVARALDPEWATLVF